MAAVVQAMNRVPASLAVVMLAASGHPVSPITLRSWVYRGHISRQEGGYDLREILDYIERRESTMTTATPSMPSSVKPDDDLLVFGLPLTVQLPPRICRSSDDTCPTYGGEMCPDDQALVDKCQHC